MTRRDFDRYTEALSIVPVVEGGQPVATGIGGRKGKGKTFGCVELDGVEIQIPSYRERTAREFHPQWRARMKITIPFAREPDSRHGSIEIGHLDSALQDEIEIGRKIATTRVDAGAGAARQDGVDAGLRQRTANGQGDIQNWRSFRDFHKGLPI